MAEGTIEEHDLTNVHDMKNMEDLHNLENSDMVEYVENPEDVGNMENLENEENVEDMENGQNLEENAEGLENGQNLEDNLEVMGNQENVHNLEENAEGLENGQNLEVMGNLENVRKLEETSENIGLLENLGSPTYVQSLTENSEDLGNPEELHPPEDTQCTENKSLNTEEKKWPGWPGENVFRMLVPVQRVGGIIGRKGEYIKKICEETKARIKILDGPPGTSERTVLVSAKEEPDLPVSPAMEGLLRIHKRIIDADTDPANVTSSGTICTRLLVAAMQAGSLIGKQGSTIKSIQDASNCIIRVLGGEHLPISALPDDSVVEVQGDSEGVHKAVELIISHLRKFLVDRSVVGVFETQMQMPNAHAPQNMPPTQSWGPSQGFAAGSYGPSPQYMPPPRQFDNYYPPGEMAPMDKAPRHGPPSYARDSSMGAHTTNVQPQQSMVTKVTQNMQIPLSYADAVIGTSGANISYIRRASGATIAIQETRGVPGEMTVEITGSASQVQTAQQLIQNFIADAANSAQSAVGGPPGAGYNHYPSHGTVYGSAAPSTMGHASHAPSGEYGSLYGSNHGY